MIQIFDESQRVKFVLFISCLSIGYYYGVSIPQSLEITLKLPPFSLTPTSYNLINLATNILALIFLIPVGIWINKSSIKTCLSVVLMVGIFVNIFTGFVFSVRMNGYMILVYLSRGVIGLVGVCLTMLTIATILKITKYKYSWLIGISMSIPSIFSGISDIITTQVINTSPNVPLTFYISGGVSALAFTIGLVFINYYLKQQTTNLDKISSTQNLPLVSCNDFGKFNTYFWLFTLLNFNFIFCYTCFSQSMTDLLVKSFGIPYTTCGYLSFLSTLLQVIMSFIFGKIITLRGQWKKRIYLFSYLYNFILTVCLYLLPTTQQPTTLYYAIIIGFMLFLGNALAVKIIVESWIQKVVDERYISLALSIGVAIVTFSQTLSPILTNFIVNDANIPEEIRYHRLIFALVILSGVNVLISLWINFNFQQFQYLDESQEEDKNEEQQKLNELKEEKEQELQCRKEQESEYESKQSCNGEEQYKESN